MGEYFYHPRKFHRTALCNSSIARSTCKRWQAQGERKLSSSLRKLTLRVSDQRHKMIAVPCGFLDKCEDKSLIFIDHEKKYVQDFKPFHNERKEEI